MAITTIAIADDHPLILHSIKSIFEPLPDFDIVSEYICGRELLNSLVISPTQLVITDFAMGTSETALDGFLKLRMLRDRVPQVRVVLLTSQSNPGILMKAFDYGVRAVVSKADHIQETVRACSHVRINEGRYSSPTIRALIESRDLNGGRSTVLSPKEMDVIRLFATGCTLSQIAERQKRTISTISTQKYNAMQKLGVSSNTELIRYAYEYGLI